jgi:hypothetical protein
MIVTSPKFKGIKVFLARDINVNSVADAFIFTGLPPKYIIRRLTLYGASTNLTTAAIELRTASAGGGTALVAPFSLAALTALAKFIDATLAAITGTDYRTENSLYLRNSTAQGSAATVSARLEVCEL